MTSLPLRIIPRAVFHTLWISFPTLLEGTLRRPQNHSVYDARIDSWSRKLVNDAEIEIEVTGREHVVPGRAYVVMSNHLSHYDIPVVFQALRIPLRMVAKAELFRIPIWGRAMRTAGFAEVDRKNRERAIEGLRRAKETMADGVSTWIAPEGTRSPTGVLGRFKQGGFHLAIDTGAPILPVAIWGTQRILKKHTWQVTPGQRVRVHICPPIDTQSFGPDRRSELTAAVRAAILEHLPPEARDASDEGHANANASIPRVTER